MFLLALQVQAYLNAKLLSAWLIGGGLGLLFVGAIAWFHYLDDRRSSDRSPAADEFPTADEFEQRFQEEKPSREL